MPLAFTQEDFLVADYFTSSHEVQITNLAKIFVHEIVMKTV